MTDKIKKIVIIFLYRESVGELNVALPIIKKISNKLNSEKVYFHFISNDKYKKVDSTYKKIIHEFGEISVGNINFLKLLLKLISKNIIIISSDFCPEFEYNQIKTFFPNSTSILMHHAQSILYKEEKDKTQYNTKSKNEIYNPDFFLVGNKIDYKNEYFSKNNYNIDKNKIYLIGALNYEKSWIDYLLLKNDKINNYILDKKKDFKKSILVTTRAPHKKYMREEDYKYQVQSILEISDKFPEFLFIIKPHPREKVKIYTKVFSDSKKSKNMILSKDNAYDLCAKVDLVISFWSSVIQDCAITNTPVIEFHRHDKKNAKLLIFEDNRYKSFFEYYGFSKYVDNKEDLIKLILNEDDKNIFNQQIENIKDIFIPKNEDIENTLNKILFNTNNKQKLLINNYNFSKFQVIFIYLKNMFLKYISKKLNKLF